MFISIYIYTYKCMCVPICIYKCVYISICICIYICISKVDNCCRGRPEGSLFNSYYTKV